MLQAFTHLFDKLYIKKLTNVSTSVNNLKTEVDKLDVGKLKTFPVDLEKINDVADNEVDEKQNSTH